MGGLSVNPDYVKPVLVHNNFVEPLRFDHKKVDDKIQCVVMKAPNTAPYGSTGSAYAPLACRYLVLALSSFISAY
ncbi:hypothetical protein D9C73_008779 [Collichthys lucidus]|uniref:Uncharacterized protein n=1 Tax=Collichthys lucidus TaxID=240159 RepID=A0A4U5UIT0_COLLU|nr:hypothetical protein D9C73_008779 [Collichthys lucidus]